MLVNESRVTPLCAGANQGGGSEFVTSERQEHRVVGYGLLEVDHLAFRVGLLDVYFSRSALFALECRV